MYTWGFSFEAVMAANHKHTFNLTHPLVHMHTHTHTICTVTNGVVGSLYPRLHSRLSFPRSVSSKHPQIAEINPASELQTGPFLRLSYPSRHLARQDSQLEGTRTY